MFYDTVAPDISDSYARMAVTSNANDLTKRSARGGFWLTNLEKVNIKKATIEAVERVVPLFDAYRQFYEQPTDPEGARNFLGERLRKSESVILLAWEGDRCVGFAQLYPSFSSLSMGRMFILNDLFVLSSARGHGVGRALLDQCKRMASEAGAKELTLETMKNNLTAQHLYEGCGWKRDDVFYKYFLSTS